MTVALPDGARVLIYNPGGEPLAAHVLGQMELACADCGCAAYYCETTLTKTRFVCCASSLRLPN